MYTVLVGKAEGNRLGRLPRRWEDNIKIGHREVGWGRVDWIVVAQDGLGGTGAAKFCECDERECLLMPPFLYFITLSKRNSCSDKW
jgi:hypothetical protein